MGTLYIVPTPIGNLEDITLRALRVLREVRLIAAEDTRTTRILLQHYGIATPTTSYHEHNRLTKLDAIFAALEAGDVALVSDAGMPGISDPGMELIQAAIRSEVTLVPLPGANAALTALVASGLPTDRFRFAGFPPRKPNPRRDFLVGIRQESDTLILYESPNRAVDLLRDIVEVMPGRQVCAARELTKLYEQFVRGPVEDVLAYFEAHEPRGEFVIVLGGAPAEHSGPWDEAAVTDALRQRLAAGDRTKDAAQAVALAAGWDRRAVYTLALTLRDSR